MNPIEGQLSRLFRTASLAQDHAIATAPFGLETRVLAAWRNARSASIWDTALLGRALILAGVVMALSFGSVLFQTTSPLSESLQLADSDSTSQVDLTP